MCKAAKVRQTVLLQCQTKIRKTISFSRCLGFPNYLSQNKMVVLFSGLVKQLCFIVTYFYRLVTRKSLVGYPKLEHRRVQTCFGVSSPAGVVHFCHKQRNCHKKCLFLVRNDLSSPRFELTIVVTINENPLDCLVNT